MDELQIVVRAILDASQVQGELNSKVKSLKSPTVKIYADSSGIQRACTEINKATATMSDRQAAVAQNMAAMQTRQANIASQQANKMQMAWTNAYNRTTLASQKAADNQIKAQKKLESVQLQKSTASSSLNAFFDQNSAAKNNRELMSMYDGIQTRLKNINDTDMSGINKQINNLKARTKELNLTTGTFFTELKNNAGKFTQWYLIGGAVAGITNEVKQLYTNVKLVDDAMTDLKKVTDETDITYSSFIERTAATAKEIGSGLFDLISSSADWARLGYNLTDAEELARVASIYKNVGDMAIDEATQNLISITAGYGIQAEQAMSVVDKMNEVGNNFSISSAGLGEALRVGGAALSAGGNSLEQSIGLVVAGNAALQDPDTVGQALKTVSMRLRNTKGELEELGEDAEGAAESVTKLQTQLLNRTGGKVDIMLDENTFKSTYDIMVELSKVWDDLTDKDRADILELVAGKHRGTAVASILTNMAEGEEAYVTALNSEGSALKENEKYLDSIQGKLDQLKAVKEALAVNTLDSEWVKGIVSGTTAVVELVDKVGILNIALTALAMGGFKKLTGAGKFNMPLYLKAV